MKSINKYLKKTLAALGVILWVGALSPEIFISSGRADTGGRGRIYGNLFLWRSGQRRRKHS